MPKKKARAFVAPKPYEALVIEYSDLRSVRQSDGSTRYVWKDKRERRRRAAELKSEGMSVRQIAERLHVSHATIERDLTQFYNEQSKP